MRYNVASFIFAELKTIENILHYYKCFWIILISLPSIRTLIIDASII